MTLVNTSARKIARPNTDGLSFRALPGNIYAVAEGAEGTESLVGYVRKISDAVWESWGADTEFRANGSADGTLVSNNAKDRKTAAKRLLA